MRDYFIEAELEHDDPFNRDDITERYAATAADCAQMAEDEYEAERKANGNKRLVRVDVFILRPLCGGGCVLPFRHDDVHSTDPGYLPF